ncbi:MAG TPA: hypothetical protein DEG76_09275 [Pseudohongiella sp.]|nr:hypothetical protein [Pseudohongiella sp.]|tara:strand:- start:55765 stop:55977 length:213 start_codon:yes stop_codon:yes gene_type:complete
MTVSLMLEMASMQSTAADYSDITANREHSVTICTLYVPLSIIGHGRKSLSIGMYEYAPAPTFCDSAMMAA